MADLVQAVWGGRGRVILDDPAGERLDAIASADGSDEADVWLTWEFTPVAGGTRVHVRLNELERGPDPGEELVELLDALALAAGDSDAPAHDA